MTVRKLCLAVDSQVKIWACTLSYKNCHLTLVCFQHNFGTILTIFAKFRYYFDFDKLAKHFNLQEMKNYVPFQSSLKSIAYFSFFCVRNLKAVECLFMFSIPKFDLFLFLSDGKKSISNLLHITS